MQQEIADKNAQITNLNGNLQTTSSLDFNELEEVIKKQNKEISRLKKEKLLQDLDSLQPKKIANYNAYLESFEGLILKF